MHGEHVDVDDQSTGWSSIDRTRKPPTLFVLDPRRYRRHRGRFLYADRVLVGGSVWTPIVRVRARMPRAADGGTEI